MSDKELVISVTLKDCIVQTFSAGGPGGQNQNRRSTGVRIIHEPSGARAESREQRSQLQNKKSALKKLSETKEFRLWVKKQVGGDALLIAEVERELWPDRLQVETKNDEGEWIG